VGGSETGSRKARGKEESENLRGAADHRRSRNGDGIAPKVGGPAPIRKIKESRSHESKREKLSRTEAARTKGSIRDTTSQVPVRFSVHRHQGAENRKGSRENGKRRTKARISLSKKRKIKRGGDEGPAPDGSSQNREDRRKKETTTREPQRSAAE